MSALLVATHGIGSSLDTGASPALCYDFLGLPASVVGHNPAASGCVLAAAGAVVSARSRMDRGGAGVGLEGEGGWEERRQGLEDFVHCFALHACLRRPRKRRWMKLPF